MFDFTRSFLFFFFNQKLNSITRNVSIAKYVVLVLAREEECTCGNVEYNHASSITAEERFTTCACFYFFADLQLLLMLHN